MNTVRINQKWGVKLLGMPLVMYIPYIIKYNIVKGFLRLLDVHLKLLYKHNKLIFMINLGLSCKRTHLFKIFLSCKRNVFKI